MKNMLKLILPKKVVNVVKGLVYSFWLLPEYAYWFRNDMTQSSWLANERSTLAGLMVTSHVLEKGITMPERRFGFGYQRVREIIKKNKSAIKDYTESHIEIQSSLKDLEQYLQMHQAANYELPEDIQRGINELLKYKQSDTIACFECTPEELFKKTNDFYEFAHSRHTVRWYSEKPVDNDLLLKAIELAQTAPSACNRQSTKVYIVETKEIKDEVRKLQNGNRGFGHLADKWLLITSDMKCWSYRSRTSAYLDAGIFTMSLLNALHYYKIAACTLNAHLTVSKLKKLRKSVNYSKSEIPIVFISIGKAPDHFMVAGSQRIKTEQIYKFV